MRFDHKKFTPTSVTFHMLFAQAPEGFTCNDHVTRGICEGGAQHGDPLGSPTNYTLLVGPEIVPVFLLHDVRRHTARQARKLLQQFG